MPLPFSDHITDIVSVCLCVSACVYLSLSVSVYLSVCVCVKYEGLSGPIRAGRPAPREASPSRLPELRGTSTAAAQGRESSTETDTAQTDDEEGLEQVT